ncbi:MAG TPA: hypothetical protein DCQ31_19390 [Bacteroidales bacterium]|nr:hypothetical protein [Bacteroidales bacterium]
MENLFIANTFAHSSPQVSLNADTGDCEILGESYMESADKYYQVVIDWVNEYVISDKTHIKFDFRLNYFNTNSSRCILEIFLILREFEKNGGEVIINWYCKKFDTDMVEEVEDFSLDSGLKIHLIPIEA